MSTVKDIKIIEAKLELKDGSNGKIAIISYHGEGDIIKSLNEAVSLYVGDNDYIEFVDSSMNDPWTRIITNNIEIIQLYDFNSFLLKKDRISKIKNINDSKDNR